MSRHFFLVWGSVSLGDGEGRLVNFCPIYYFLSKVMSPVSCYNSGCEVGLGFSGTLLLVWWSVPLRYWYHISNAAFSFPFLLGRRMQSFFMVVSTYSWNVFPWIFCSENYGSLVTAKVVAWTFPFDFSFFFRVKREDSTLLWSWWNGLRCALFSVLVRGKRCFGCDGGSSVSFYFVHFLSIPIHLSIIFDVMWTWTYCFYSISIGGRECIEVDASR